MARLEDAGISTIDKTATSQDGFRNMKIVYYLQRNLNDKYIILDDEESIFEEGKNTLNLYVTDNMEGFQRWIIDKMKPHMRKLRSPL